jgi:hypothetical protein
MAITKALMYARVSSTSSTGTGLYKKARLGATRLNFFGPKLLCTVAGSARSRNFDRDTYQVLQRKRGQPTQLTIEFFGFTPTEGQEVVLGAGSLTNRLFRGKIVRVSQVRYRLNQGRVIWRCTCLSWEYVADGVRSVSAKFQSTSGTTIATSLVSTYGPAGFTANHVQTGLATLGEIQFTQQSLNDALQQLCDRLGAYFYWDFDKDLHLFTTDSTVARPETLNSSNRHVHQFQHEKDIEDLRNRIIVEGAGGTVTAPVAAGATTIPMDTVEMFASSSTNYAKLEAQRITYTGKSALTGGSQVAGIPQNPSAPTAAVAGGSSGDVLGAVSYKVVNRSAAGNSEPSAASSTVTPTAVSAPGSALTATATSGASGNLDTNTYRYKTTFVTSKGETLAGSDSSPAGIAAVTGPSAPFASGTTGGSMALGTYYYAVTYVTSAGETESLGTANTTLTGAQNAASLTISTSLDARVTARRIYRSVANNPAQLFLVTTINNNTATTYTDTAADASLSVTTIPHTNTTGWGQMSLTSIPTSGDGRVTARRIYRQDGSGNYLLVATISDNTTTTYTDNTATGNRGQVEPAVESAGGGVVTVTVPVGPAGTTSRAVYRTVASGAVYKYVGSIGDNTTTSYADSKADDRLGDDAPSGSTFRTDAGSSTLRVSDLSQFPAGGWVRVDGQVISFTGRSAASGEGTLTGIPTSGVGAIASPLAAGASILNEPHLTGVSGLVWGLAVGASINLIEISEDATSQSTYGTRELFVQDRRLSREGAQLRGQAELALRKDPRTTASYQTSDPKARAGAPITIDLFDISTTLVHETVTIKPQKGRPQPFAEAQLASRSSEDLHAQLRELRDRLNQ